MLKKYRAAVAQVSQEQAALQEAASQVAALEAERNSLKEQLAEMSARVESAEGEQVSNLTQRRLEMKARELESRLELEQTTKTRQEVRWHNYCHYFIGINPSLFLLSLKKLLLNYVTYFIEITVNYRTGSQ